MSPYNSRDLASIAAVATRFGLTHRAIRFYEERGLLTPVRRGSARLYDEAQCNRLELIVKWKHLGFTLAEIADQLEAADNAGSPVSGALDLDSDRAEAQLAFLEARREEIDSAIAELRAALNEPAAS